LKKRILFEYQGGNFFSILNALQKINLTAHISKNPSEILSADALVLPGVGSFPVAMSELKMFGLDSVIAEFVKKGRPLLGICLGMQLLFSLGHEFGEHRGLGIIEGDIEKIPQQEKTTLNEIIRPVPQIGWNNIYPMFDKTWEYTLFEHLKPNFYFYFVHSFYVKPKNPNVTLSLTNYEGFEFCSSLFWENIFATQFHPEKSGKEGLYLLNEWKKYFLD